MSKPKHRVPAGVVPHATPAELTGHVPHTAEELAAAEAEVEASLVDAPAMTWDEVKAKALARGVIAKGAAVLYTNAKGVGPWPGVILADATTNGARGALFPLRVTKPYNGTVFETAAPMGDGPDTFTLAE